MVATEAVTDTVAATAVIVVGQADSAAVVVVQPGVVVEQLAAVVADAVNRIKLLKLLRESDYQARPY